MNMHTWLFCLLFLFSSGQALAQAEKEADGATMKFEDIIAPTGRKHADSYVLMTAWTNAHPSDKRTPRGLVWMAQLHIADQDPKGAQPLFLRVYHDYPGTEWALHSLKGLADMDREERRYGAAIAKYDALTRSGIPFFTYVGRMAGRRAREERLRFDLTAGLIAGFLLMWTLRLLRLRSLRALWPPPAEVLYPLPILFLITASALGQPADEGHGLLLLGIGGTLLLWLNGAYLRARPPARIWRIVHGLMGVAQAGALLYAAVVISGLWEKFHDTLVMGAD